MGFRQQRSGHGNLISIFKPENIDSPRMKWNRARRALLMALPLPRTG
jgi:hypothetical protein